MLKLTGVKFHKAKQPWSKFMTDAISFAPPDMFTIFLLTFKHVVLLHQATTTNTGQYK